MTSSDGSQSTDNSFIRQRRLSAYQSDHIQSRIESITILRARWYVPVGACSSPMPSNGGRLPYRSDDKASEVGSWTSTSRASGKEASSVDEIHGRPNRTKTDDAETMSWGKRGFFENMFPLSKDGGFIVY